MKNRTTRTALAGLLTLAFALFAGCGNDTITVPDPDQSGSGAPALPSMSTMKMDLDFLGATQPALDPSSLATGKPSDDLTRYAAAANRANWINAFVRAIFVQLLMYDALEEPIGAFALAVHSVPQPQADGSYLWTYIFVDDDGTEYSIFLFGKPMNSHVEWRMEVSSSDPALPLDHFVWFDGVSRNDDTGYWQFYDPIDETTGTESFRIDYAEGSLRVEANGVGHPDEGDYLEIQETADNGHIEHYDASADELGRIEWNADGSGSITVHDYNNGEKACWDTEQIDTVCP